MQVSQSVCMSLLWEETRKFHRLKSGNTSTQKLDKDCTSISASTESSGGWKDRLLFGVASVVTLLLFLWLRGLLRSKDESVRQEIIKTKKKYSTIKKSTVVWRDIIIIIVIQVQPVGGAFYGSSYIQMSLKSCQTKLLQFICFNIIWQTVWW